MSRSSIIVILVVVLLAAVAIVLGTIDTSVAPTTVQKDMLNEAAAQ